MTDSKNDIKNNLETDKLRIAKELVRKAIELGDDELLAMANGLITSNTESNTNDIVADTVLPTHEEKKKGNRKSKKAIKKPGRKSKIVSDSTSTSTSTSTQTVETKQDDNFIFSIYGDNPEAKDNKESRLRPDGKLNCKRRKINVNTQPIDTGIEKNDPMNKKLKKITPVVQSFRKNVNPFIKMVCEDCGKAKEISRSLYRENYICDRCILKKGGN